jgi:pimeloyl-ACP methyl ester carboxylesterase
MFGSNSSKFYSLGNLAFASALCMVAVESTAVASTFSIKEIADRISTRTEIPILLPTESIVERNKFDRTETIYANDDTIYLNRPSNYPDYEVSFNNRPGSVGNAALRFVVEAKFNGDFQKDSVDPDPNYKRTYKQVKLVDGSTSTVTTWCGGTACWARIEWKSKKVLYKIVVKAPRPTVVIELANSAISAGDRNPRSKKPAANSSGTSQRPGNSASRPPSPPTTQTPRPKPTPPQQSKPTPPKPTTSQQITPQEIALLDQQTRTNPKLDSASTSQRQALQQKASQYLNPFVGGWTTADNRSLFIYPSTRKERQACIIIENGTSQDLQIGVAIGNTVGTDLNVGRDRLINIKKPNTLALRPAAGGKPIAVNAAPLSVNINDNNRQAMEQNGCLTQFPGTTTIATKPAQAPASKPAQPKPATIGSNVLDVTNVTCKDEKKPVRMLTVEAIQPNAPSGKLGIDGTGNSACTGQLIEQTKRHIFFKEVQNPPGADKTWVVIHGWNNYSRSQNIKYLALQLAQIKSLKNDRILLLDWSEAAFSGLPDVYSAATWIRPVAEIAVSELIQNYGITPSEASSKLILIGHSLGSLMTAEIGAVYMDVPANATSIKAKPVVKTIIALDPPSDSIVTTPYGLSGYDVDLRTPSYLDKGKKLGIFTDIEKLPDGIEAPKKFRDTSIFSRAFVGSSSVAGNKKFAGGAHESFLLDPGALRPVPPTFEHGEVISLFASIMNVNGFGGLLGPNDLQERSEFKKNVFESDHEGVIKFGSRLQIEHSNGSKMIVDMEGNVFGDTKKFTNLQLPICSALFSFNDVSIAKGCAIGVTKDFFSIP